ncbi:MAG: acetoacetate decarboxylase family protein [Candidatus Eremiobacteraeota bacterium]|nr:acetoacetate decarboxylase family protein [Candidatus Eremiobacteraeota bacterium]MBC5803521.1 acetoacetate decarboxylase family protein [Candidatus Eremiobacteraeota bacterium]MBC5822129.1 acetoacetate decarboxylase family protein [Candidatus Eremiobacteraeota bacterium]
MSEPAAPYPPAPWRLRGWGAATLHAVDVAAVRRILPAGVHIVHVWPGRTLGGLAFLSYERGSSLVYHELCVVAALVRIGRRFGFWLPRLDVDSDASLQGGHAIWSLPKRLAAFEIDETSDGTDVRIHDAAGLTCRMTIRDAAGGQSFRFPLMSLLPALAPCRGTAHFFTAGVVTQVRLAHLVVEAPRDGMIATLGLNRPSVLAFRLDELRLNVPAAHADVRFWGKTSTRVVSRHFAS